MSKIPQEIAEIINNLHKFVALAKVNNGALTIQASNSITALSNYIESVLDESDPVEGNTKPKGNRPPDSKD
jgi:hypothetical protein